MFSLTLTYPTQAQEEQIVGATTTDNRRAGAAGLRPRRVDGAPASGAAGARLTACRLLRCLARPRLPAPHEPGALPFVKKYVEWGAGPRASQYLVLGAKARAILMGKPAPTANDVRAVAAPVLSHRIIRNYAAVRRQPSPPPNSSTRSSRASRNRAIRADNA